MDGFDRIQQIMPANMNQDSHVALVLADMEGNALKPDDHKTYRLPMTPTG